MTDLEVTADAASTYEGKKKVFIDIRTPADIKRHIAGLRSTATKIQSWFKAHDSNALDLLRALKFQPVWRISDRCAFLKRLQADQPDGYVRSST